MGQQGERDALGELARQVRGSQAELLGGDQSLAGAGTDAREAARGRLRLRLPGRDPGGRRGARGGRARRREQAVPGGGTKPDALMVDRGRGFYNAATGSVTKKYSQALRDRGFKNPMGDDASAQPGHAQDIRLRETAVSWMRLRPASAAPSKQRLETAEQRASRLRRVVDDINVNLDVEGLCKGLPKRLDLVIEAKGGRVPK